MSGTIGVHSTTTGEAVVTLHAAEHELLPPGLDSARYRCCGNGVVSQVTEWIGQRLADVVKEDA